MEETFAKVMRDGERLRSEGHKVIALSRWG